MRKRNLGITAICLAALLAGCGQAPASIPQEETVLDIRMEAQVTDTVSPGPATETSQTDVITTEPKPILMTEPIQEQSHTEQHAPAEESKPYTLPADSNPETPTQVTSKEDTMPEAPVAPPTSSEPRPTEPKPTQATTEAPAQAPTEPPSEATTQAPNEEPVTSPTESTTEQATEPVEAAHKEYDLAAVIAYANSYAEETYGFVPDSSLNLGNASYYPGFYGAVSSEQDLYNQAIGHIQYAYTCFQALGYDLTGLHCNLHASYEATTGMYRLVFLYG